MPNAKEKGRSLESSEFKACNDQPGPHPERVVTIEKLFQYSKYVRGRVVAKAWAFDMRPR